MYVCFRHTGAHSINICICVDLHIYVNALASIAATRYSSSVAVALAELLKLIFALAMLPPKAEIGCLSSHVVMVGF